MDKFKDNFELMKQGKLYNPNDKKLFLKHVRALALCDRYNRVSVINHFRRSRIIKRLIPNCGKNCFILSNFHCEYGSNITIGDDFFSNFDCSLLDVAPIAIGNGVMLGARVIIATPVHPLLAEERMQKQYPDGYHDIEYSKPVTIGDNVWIASGVTVCGGVTIGEGAVIGAGSVVTRDVPPNCLAVGVPCKVIRQLDESDRLNVWDTYVAESLPMSKRDREKQTK